MDRSTLEAQIREKAQRDPDFRARLLSDVDGAIADEFGIEIPAGVTVRVIEETESEVVLALPPALDPNAPIPESELAGVAGGSSYGCPPSTNDSCEPHASQCCSG